MSECILKFLEKEMSLFRYFCVSVYEVRAWLSVIMLHVKCINNKVVVYVCVSVCLFTSEGVIQV